MYLNEVLSYKKSHLKRYTKDISKIKFKKHDVLVFDIEACAINNHTEMLNIPLLVLVVMTKQIQCIGQIVLIIF